ncbi:T9SS type A sorting domain-containing protein [bacterium]|nr:T9SS type A sorting domain-containing protein [bacterium]
MNDNKIKGFLQVEKQLRLLDDTLDYWLQTEEPAPQYITSATQNGISIIPNKQLLNYLFTYILEQLPYENIVEADAKAAIKNTTKAENDSLPMEVAEIILIKSMKPNPAVDALTLTFVEKDRYEIFITDMQGKNLLQEKCKCDELTLDVASLPRGNHLLTAVSKKEKQTLQLILQ